MIGITNKRLLMPYKHDYDKAMTRLSIIINKLYEGQEISIKELADEFGCSTPPKEL